MTTLLRALSFLIAVAGLVVGTILIVQAQPAEPYGDVSTVLVAYGLGIVVSGLFWGVLGANVARAVGVVEGMDDDKTTSSDEQSSETQHEQAGGSGLIALIVVVGSVLLVILIIMASGA